MMIADLWAMRAAATAFVDEAVRRLVATGAKVMGCTSTSEQHVASVALLRRVRELDPGVEAAGKGGKAAVDNILDMGYYKSLLPMLASDGRQRRIFYEIKANVSRAHVEAMVRAGSTWVQPGIESLPIGSMGLIYPLGSADLNGLAYFFATEPMAGPLRYATSREEAIAKRPGMRTAFDAARDWRVDYTAAQPVLTMDDHDDVLEITDTRTRATAPRRVLTGLDRAVCLACDAAPRQGKLAEIIERDFGLTASDSQIAEVVTRLRSDRLVLAMDGRLVGLAVRGPVPELPGIDDFPAGMFLLARSRAGLMRSHGDAARNRTMVR